MALKIYDPDQVSCSFAGIPIFQTEHTADGEFLSVAMESDAFNDVVGSNGGGTRPKSNDQRATVTIKLMQSSETNALLSAIHNADLAAPNGAGVGALLIRDRNGTTLLESTAAWIVKAPDISMDRQATTREWVIKCASLKRFDGGN